MKYSIIICAYNEELHIENCLKSLIPQIISEEEVELLIIDDGSEDDTAKICNNILEELDFPAKIIFESISHRGLFESRNYGIESSTGEFIFFLDSDAIIDSQWFVNIRSSFGNENVDLVSGKVKHLNKESKIATFLFYAHFDCISIKEKSRVLNINESYMIGANMGFRRIVFDKVGGFITLLKNRGDDTYINRKYKKEFPKRKEFYNNEAIVFNEHTDSLKIWLLQGYFGGRNNALIHKLLKETTKVTWYSYLLIIMVFLSLLSKSFSVLLLVLIFSRFFSRYVFLVRSFKNVNYKINFLTALLTIPLHFIAFNLHDIGFIYQKITFLTKWRNESN